MAVSRAVVSRWVRMVGATLAVAGACLALAGTAAAESAPPDIAGGSASPSSLSHEGGSVQISAEVTDDVSVQRVTAVIYGSDGSLQEVQLYQGDPTTFYGTFEAPYNYYEEPVDYSIEIQAYDDENNYSATTVAGVEVMGQPQFDEPPYFGETQLFPNYLSAEGGEVTIRVQASDNRGISEIYATIAGPGDGEIVPLQAFESNRFEGIWHAPANPGPAVNEYPIEVSALDDIGQETRITLGTVTEEAPTPPPPPPSPGILQPKAPGHIFNAIKLGKQAHWTFAIRNLPRGKKGGAVSGVARIAGSPAFSLDGAPAEGVHFTLQPGEKLKLPVTFAPIAAGPQSAAIEIVRDDGGQAGLAATLSGEGRGAEAAQAPEEAAEASQVEALAVVTHEVVPARRAERRAACGRGSRVVS
jgi:hypothetical protein